MKNLPLVYSLLVIVFSITSFASTKDLNRTCFSESSQQADFAGGDGSIQTPYGICNLAQLSHMTNPKASYELWNDIDAKASQLYPQSFKPLFSLQNPFMGQLDGRGHSIIGLAIKRPNENGVGLFSACIECKIRNLNLKNVNIEGKNQVGGLIGSYIVDATWYGSVVMPATSNVVVDGIVLGEGISTGGVFGYVYDVTPWLSDTDFIKIGVAFKGDVIDTLTRSHGSQIGGEYEYD